MRMSDWSSDVCSSDLLAVVGTGPGDPVWRTPEVAAAVLRASDLVGYGLYLDLLGPLAAGKARHGHALGEEETRVRVALDLAAEGRDVALVCSGAPRIYAMETLVFELGRQNLVGGNRWSDRFEAGGPPNLK